MTEYCTELYNRPVTGDTSVLNVINENKEPQLTILRHEIESAVNSLKIGKSRGIVNIPAELIGQMAKSMDTFISHHPTK